MTTSPGIEGRRMLVEMDGTALIATRKGSGNGGRFGDTLGTINSRNLVSRVVPGVLVVLEGFLDRSGWYRAEVEGVPTRHGIGTGPTRSLLLVPRGIHNSPTSTPWYHLYPLRHTARQHGFKPA